MSNETEDFDETSSYSLKGLIDLPIICGSESALEQQDHIRDDQIVGKVIDMVARFDEESYPPVTGLLMISHGSEFFIPIRYVLQIKPTKIVLAPNSPTNYEPFLRRPMEALLARDILNHKLIHISKQHHPSLVKADDFQITQLDSSWSLTSLMQLRQGKIKSIFKRKQPEVHLHHKIDFLNVEPFMSHVPTSKLRLRHNKLAEIHPSELADLLESANPAESEEILDAVGENEELEADVIEELEDDHQVHIVSKRSNEEIAELLSNMEPDDAADLIAELTQERREPVLRLIPFQKQQDLRKLLGYNSETAGGLMNSEIIKVNPEITVDRVLQELKHFKLNPTLMDTVFVVDDNNVLLGYIRTAELIKLNFENLVKDVFHNDVPTIQTGADFPEIVTLMSDFNLYSLAVVDDENRLMGAITVDDILEKLVPENWRKRALVDRN